MKIIVADHYGFCMGVRRAIDIAEKTANQDKPLTIYREIIHNESVIDYFKEKGARFCADPSDVTKGNFLIPAHGAPPDIIAQAEKNGLNVIDAACPLVLRIHRIVNRLDEQDYHIIHFGKSDHDETIAIKAQAPDSITIIEKPNEIAGLKIDNDRIALTVQTTAVYSEFQEIEKLARKKFPKIEIFNTICNATERRQKTAAKLAEECDLFLVVGSKKSANTRHLLEIALKYCSESYLLNGPQEFQEIWLTESKPGLIGITAGASTPHDSITAIIEKIKSLYDDTVEIHIPKKSSDDTQLYLDN